MAYVPNNFKIYRDDNDPTWETLLMVDYMFHHQDNDYDDGLSFLDRLNHKIGRFHPEWNIEEYKDRIRNSNDPVAKYVHIVSNMLSDPTDVFYYGV
jgi:hypothetical protein